MKPLLHKIDVTCALELDARDVELLECLTSYENKNIVKNIFGEEEKGHAVSYNGGVNFAQMCDFLDRLRDSAKTMKGTINAHAKQGLIR